MNIKKLFRSKKFIYISALVFIVLFSVGYSALSQVLNIGGSTRYNKKYPVRVTGIQLQGTSNSGTEQFNPNYTYNTTTTGVDLPNLNSTVTYTVTVRNYGSEDKGINLNITNNSNTNMTYETSNMPTNNIIPANSTKTFNITIKYNTSTLSETTTDTMVITYTFGKIGAMFLPGQQVNVKMKKFVNSGATYTTQDTTITNIARYTGTPNSSYLIDANKVSTDEYIYPIYMWYDSTSTTIYWYSEAINVYYNPDSSYFFANLRAINSISNMSDTSSEYVTTMSSMFNYTGYNSTSFTLDLGSKFDTSNVTDMSSMFSSTGSNSTVFTLDLGDKFDTSNVETMFGMFTYTGQSSPVFTLDLGDKFDTSNVTNMSYMFQSTGRSSPVFTLDLGLKFDTSNVTTMSNMFYNTGYSNTSFTLDLGDKFDTSNVTSMSYMFYYTGYSSTVFTLDLGDKFDTSNVTYMSYMFNYTGYNSTSFTLDLEDKFDTSNVTTMSSMFDKTGYNSTIFTIDLGDKFDTSNVTNMSGMFDSTGRSSTVFNLNIGDKFDTSNVTNMSNMFYSTGYSNTSFTLDLGDKFDTSNVTKMSYMFYRTGCHSTSFTLDLGDKFDTSKVTYMQSMFDSTGQSSTVFTLDLGDKFDTSNVTNMSSMFDYTGYSSTVFTLDLGDKFDTSNVTNMSQMFSGIGSNKPNLTLNLGDKFDTSNVTNMSYMFSSTGFSSSVFTLNLGSNFDTGNVTDMSYMFYNTGYSSTVSTLDLGDKFDTSKVTKMDSMFRNSRYLKTIYAPSTFTTTAVTSSANMFTGCTNLVGGLGTVYSSSHINAAYAHIDGGTSNPGYFTARTTATFKSGQEVNAKMKQFVNSSATYSTQDTTITNIARYIGTPNSSNLIDANKVSTSDSELPIYMWYDSTNTTIYWYTEAGLVYFNPDSSYFFHNLNTINSINNLNDISSIYTTNMESMFDSVAYCEEDPDGECWYDTSFTLSLGDKFNTKNVTNMKNMFSGMGSSNNNFTMDLGPNFDTSNVTNMSGMFSSIGYHYYNSDVLIDLGNKFDTSNVTDMSYMFDFTGYNSASISINLGDKFDTSNVTNMSFMFSWFGAYSFSLVTLDLGDKFDTSNVTDVSYMFECSGVRTIYVSSSFDISNITNDEYMFTNNNLVGGMGSINNSTNQGKAYAHIDEGSSNPGYFTLRGGASGIISTIYYNSNTTSGSLTSSTKRVACIPANNETSCTITIPSEVSSSVGKYNSPFSALSTSINTMASASLTISADTTFYATYSKSIQNYYYNNGYTDRILYRNEYFTSTYGGGMNARLSTTITGTTNISTSGGPGSSSWYGLSTGRDTTVEYTNVQDAANSNSGVLYYVYKFSATYKKGSNVSSIGATSDSCYVTTSDTSCSITLPSITPNSGYISVGWNTTNGATTGTSAGSSYTLSSSGTTLYANAKANTETITFGSCSQGPGRLQQCYVEKSVSTIKNPSSIAFTWTNATITQGGQAGDLVVYAQYYNGSSWQDFSLVGGGNYYYGKGKYVGDGVFTYTGTINAASVPSNIQKIRLGVYSNATAYPSLTVSMESGKVVLTG